MYMPVCSVGVSAFSRFGAGARRLFALMKISSRPTRTFQATGSCGFKSTITGLDSTLCNHNSCQKGSGGTVDRWACPAACGFVQAIQGVAKIKNVAELPRFALVYSGAGAPIAAGIL